MFFLLSSFRFCPPLKNDGRSVLFCHNVLMLNEYIKERIQIESFPCLSGKVSAELTEGASVSRNEKRVSYGKSLNTCLSFLNEGKMLSGTEE